MRTTDPVFFDDGWFMMCALKQTVLEFHFLNCDILTYLPNNPYEM